MNPFFNPNRTRESKTGLEKHRHLMKYSGESSDSKMKSSIPGDWFYNEQNAEEQWKTLEKCEIVPKQNDDDALNPFTKINKETQVIRSIIENFEMTDQEFLMSVVELLEEEAEGADISTQEFLMDARVKLVEMLNEHSDNSDAQSKMLQSLRHWFSLVKQDSVVVNDLERQETVFDVTVLAQIVNDSFQNTGTSAEKAMIYHRSIVDSLSKQLSDMRKTINEQKETIENLQKEASKGKPRRKTKQISENIFRKLAVQNYKIQNLESRLSDSQRDLSKERFQREIKRSIEMDDDDEDESELEMKMLDYLGQIQQLDEQNKQLLEDNKNLHNQICKAKASEINTETKIAALERAKVNAETMVASLQEQFQKQDNFYRQQMEDLRKELSKKNDSEDISQLKYKHQMEIDDLKTSLKQQFDKDMELYEKRAKKQYNDLMETVSQGETGFIVDGITKKCEAEIAEQKEKFDKSIEQLKNAHYSRMTVLIKYYNDSIKKQKQESEDNISKIEKEKDMELENLKFEIQENTSNSKFKEHEEFATHFAELRKSVVQAKDAIDQKMQKLQRENEMYKQIIDNNDLMNEVHQINESDYVNPSEELDGVLEESMKKVTEERIEKEVNERLGVLLGNQRKILTDYRYWQAELIKSQALSEVSDDISKMRDTVMEALAKLHDISNSKKINSDVVETTIAEVLTAVKAAEDKVSEVNENPPSIPINDVESKLSQLQNRVLQLSNENTMMKATIGKMVNLSKLDEQKNVLDMIVKDAAEQLQKYNESQNTIKELQEKIVQLTTTDKVDKEVDCFPSVKSEETQFVAELRNARTQIEIEYADVETQKDSDVVPLPKSSRTPRTLGRKNKINIDGDDNIITYERMPNELVSSACSPFLSPAKSRSAAITPTGSLKEIGTDVLQAVECENCHALIPISKEICDIQSVVNPIIECPHCHSPVTVHLYGNIPELNLQGEEMKQIVEKEKIIQSSVKELIDMKQEMRSLSGAATPIGNSPASSSRNQKSDSSRAPSIKRPQSAKKDDVQMDKAIIVSRPSTPSTARSKTVRIAVPMSVSDSIYFEVFNESNKLSSGNATPRASAKLFVQPADEKEFTSEQIKAISDVENKINAHIDDLVEMKTSSKIMSPVITPAQSSRRVELEFVELEAIADVEPVKVEERRNSVDDDENDVGSVSETRSNYSYVSHGSIDIARNQKVLQKSEFSFDLSPRPHVKIEEPKEEPKQKVKEVILPQKEKEPQKPKEEPKPEQKKQKKKEQKPLPKLEMASTVLFQNEPVQKEPKKLIVDYSKTINHVFDYFVEPLPVKVEKPSVTKEQLVKLKNENEEIKTLQAQLSSFVKDLVDRHQEIVDYLSTSNVQKDKKLADKEKEEETEKSAEEKRIEQERENAAKLAAIIKERELAIEEQNELTRTLQQKNEELAKLTEEKGKKEEEITELSLENSALKSALERLGMTKQQFSDQFKIFEETTGEQKQKIKEMDEKLSNALEEKGKVERDLESAKIDIERLTAKIEMADAQKAINLSNVSPFVVFSTDEELPEKGFSLAPSPAFIVQQEPDVSSSTQSALNTSQKESTKDVPARVQTSLQPIKSKDPPKLIMPKSSLKSPTRKQPVLPSMIQKPTGFTSLVPTSTKSGKIVYASVHPNSNSYYERNSIEIRTVHEKVLNNMKKRLDNLDILLQNKGNEVIEARDLKERLTLASQKAQTDLENALRDLKRVTAFYESSKAKAAELVTIVEDRDDQIKELKKIIAQFQNSANYVMREKRRVENQEEYSQQIAQKIERSKKAVSELQVAYKGSAALRRFAERQMAALLRWEKMRKEIIEREKTRTMAVLAATGLIVKTGSHTTPRGESSEGPIRRTSNYIKPKQQQKAKHILTATPTVSKSDLKKDLLKSGVVARPISMK